MKGFKRFLIEDMGFKDEFMHDGTFIPKEQSYARMQQSNTNKFKADDHIVVEKYVAGRLAMMPAIGSLGTVVNGNREGMVVCSFAPPFTLVSGDTVEAEIRFYFWESEIDFA